MFEAVSRGFFAKGSMPAVFFAPTQLEILKPIRYERLVTNYRGPLREQKMQKNASYQLQATILVDVHYRIHGECQRILGAPDESCKAQHALKEMDARRLKERKSKYAPSLGWKEFLPTYFGVFRDTQPLPPRDEINELYSPSV